LSLDGDRERMVGSGGEIEQMNGGRSGNVDTDDRSQASVW
jgi:hypothetical protein